MPRRFKQVRRRLSAFVRVGDCRPRSVKTLVSESAYMGNSALPSGLECGGSLQREVQPLCNRCRSGLELRFEPVQPGASSCETVGFTTIVPCQGGFCGQRSPWPRYGKKTAEMDCRGPSVIDGFQFVSSSSGQQIEAGAIVSGASHGGKLLAKQRLIAGDVRLARIRHAGHQHPLHTSQLRVAQGVRCLRKPWNIWSMK